MSIPPNSQEVKTRAYKSDRRRAQAASTRHEIIEAATQLFEADGYAATTMSAIAKRANVAVETIYRGFPGKAGLFQAVVEAAVAGGAARAERPVEERPAIQAVINEPNPIRKLELYASTQPGIHARTAPLLRALREAVVVEPELTSLLRSLEAQRLEGLSRFADHLADRKVLRRGMAAGEARDLIWAINSQSMYDLLVTERGWSVDRYRQWITSMMISSLLS